MRPDDEACFRAVAGRDRRFDGVFYTAVATTGIFCRPSCPAMTPKRANVSFYASAAAAQAAGYRACRRCRPDATPGSPAWDVTADAAGRAMRLVADGIVEREGVSGLAGRMGYSTRQLNRLLTDQFGAGPLALARTRRAQTARVLAETSTMSMAEIAFAAGFASVRQFNDTVRSFYGVSPRELRRRPRGTSRAGTLETRIAVREPLDRTRLLDFLARHLVPGVEHVEGSTYERSLRLPHGPGVVVIDLGGPPTGVVPARFALRDARDLGAAMERTRRLLDADADPDPIAQVLEEDPLLAGPVRAWPGLRVPGSADGAEAAVRTILGQQVSLGAASRLLGRMTAAYGDPLGLEDRFRVNRLFPSTERLAALDPEQHAPGLTVPASRRRAVIALARAVDAGEVALDRSRDRDRTRRELLGVPGIGPWTADVVAMRALADPDVFLHGDAGLRAAAGRLGVSDLPAHSRRWRPWRSYGLMYCWTSLWWSADRDGVRHDPEET